MDKCTIKGHSEHYPKQELSRVKPFPSAPYYKYPFIVECSACHRQRIITCNTQELRAAEIDKFPPLPNFPH